MKRPISRDWVSPRPPHNKAEDFIAYYKEKDAYFDEIRAYDKWFTPIAELMMKNYGCALICGHEPDPARFWLHRDPDGKHELPVNLMSPVKDVIGLHDLGSSQVFLPGEFPVIKAVRYKPEATEEDDMPFMNLPFLMKKCQMIWEHDPVHWCGWVNCNSVVFFAAWEPEAV